MNSLLSFDFELRNRMVEVEVYKNDDDQLVVCAFGAEMGCIDELNEEAAADVAIAFASDPHNF